MVDRSAAKSIAMLTVFPSGKAPSSVVSNKHPYLHVYLCSKLLLSSENLGFCRRYFVTFLKRSCIYFSEMASGSRFARAFDLFQIKRLVDVEELTRASTLGAVLSVCGGLLLLALFCFETLAFLTPTLSQEISLIGASNAPLRVSFDVSFPAMPCHLLSLELTDVLGQRVSNFTSANIHRFTIDAATGRALLLKGAHATGAAAPGARQLAYGDAPVGDASAEGASTVLDAGNFADFIAQTDIALVTFGA